MVKTRRSDLAAKLAARLRAEELWPTVEGVVLAEPMRLPLLIVDSPELQSDWIATKLLDYYDRVFDSIGYDPATAVTDAALIACRNSSNPHLLCRAWKDSANAHMIRRHIADASIALDRAREYARTEIANLILDFTEGAMLYWDRRITAAYSKIHPLPRAFSRLGDCARAEAAQRLLNGLDYLMRDHSSVLPRMLVEVDLAIARHDDYELARSYAALAGCYSHLDQPDLARSFIAKALALTRTYGMAQTELRARRIESLMPLRERRLKEGLRQVEGIRRLCVERGAPAEATITLIYAMECLCEVDAKSPMTDDELLALETMARTAVRESSRLDLPVAAAEAAAVLKTAATRRDLRRVMEMIPVMLANIDPAAVPVDEAVSN